KSVVKAHIWSSKWGKLPTWWTLPCSYSAETGSARATFPRLAQTVVTGTLLSIMRIVASTIAPPLLRSATMRSARCARYAAIAIFAQFDGFHATQASVSKTCLVRFDNNKYSVASQPGVIDTGGSRNGISVIV